MTGLFFKVIGSVTGLIIFSSCSSDKHISQDIDFGKVLPEQNIEKTIILDFNYEAGKDPGTFVEFAFMTNDGESPADIEFTLDGKSVSGNSIRFYASDFSSKQEVKVGVRFPKGSPRTVYSGKLVLANASELLNSGITQGEERLPVKTGEEIGVWSAEYVVPLPVWLTVSIIVLSALLLIVSLIFILTRNDMPFGKKSFKSGMLTFPNCDARVSNVRLAKLTKYDLYDAFDGTGHQILLEPFDKIHRGKKIRFARLKNISQNLDLKIIHDDIEDISGPTQELYHQDEIKITDPDNKVFMFRYSNPRTTRIY